jgi:hypothetical protein
MTTVHEEQLDVVQGATFDFEFRWSLDVDDVVTPRPVGHMTAALQVRKSLKSPVLLEATTENGLIILGQGTEPDDPETGRIRFLWSGEDTMKIDVAKAVYDFELYDDHESPVRTYQLLRGSVTNILNVTRAED